MDRNDDSSRQLSFGDFLASQMPKSPPPPAGVPGQGNNRGKSWQNLVSLLVQLSEGRCQLCREQVQPLHGHHFLDWDDYPEHRRVAGNIVILCQPCHSRAHLMPQADFVSRLKGASRKKLTAFLAEHEPSLYRSIQSIITDPDFLPCPLPRFKKELKKTKIEWRGRRSQNS